MISWSDHRRYILTPLSLNNTVKPEAHYFRFLFHSYGDDQAWPIGQADSFALVIRTTPL